MARHALGTVVGARALPEPRTTADQPWKCATGYSLVPALVLDGSRANWQGWWYELLMPDGKACMIHEHYVDEISCRNPQDVVQHPYQPGAP